MTGKAVEKGAAAEVVEDEHEESEEDQELEEHAATSVTVGPGHPAPKGRALKTPVRSKVVAESSVSTGRQFSYGSNNQAKVVALAGMREQPITSGVNMVFEESATVECACGAVIHEAGRSVCNRCCRNQKLVESAKQAEADIRGCVEVFPISSGVCVNGHALTDTQAFCTGTCDRCNSYIKGGDRIFQCARCQPIYWICDSCKVHFKEPSVERGVKRVYSLDDDDAQQGFGARSKKSRRGGNADHESSDVE